MGIRASSRPRLWCVVAAVVFVLGQVPGASAQQGLSAEHFGNPNFEGEPVSAVVQTIDFAYGGSGPPGVNADQFASRYYGEITPLHSETYTFETLSDDGVRVWIDGQLIISNWTHHGNQMDFGDVDLEANQAYTIMIEHFDGWGGSHLQAWWQSPSQDRELLPAAQMRATSPPEGGVPEIRLQTSDDWALEGEMQVATGAGARLTTYRSDHWREEIAVNLRATWTGEGATLRIPEIVWTDEARTEGVIRLGPNQTSKLSAMERIDDGVFTGSMSVTIELQPGDGYTVAGEAISLSFTDDEPEPAQTPLRIGGTVTVRGALPDALIAVGAKADPDSDSWNDLVYLAEDGPYSLSLQRSEPHTVYAWVDENQDGVRNEGEIRAKTVDGLDAVRVDLVADVLDVHFYIGEASDLPDGGAGPDGAIPVVDAGDEPSGGDAAVDTDELDPDGTTAEQDAGSDDDGQDPVDSGGSSDSGCMAQPVGTDAHMFWFLAIGLLVGIRRRRLR